MHCLLIIKIRSVHFYDIECFASSTSKSLDQMVSRELTLEMSEPEYEHRSFRMVSKGSGTVYFLETRPSVILDGYIAIWTGLDGAGNLFPQRIPKIVGHFQSLDAHDPFQ